MRQYIQLYHTKVLISICTLALLAGCKNEGNGNDGVVTSSKESNSQGYKLEPIPFNEVVLEDKFWKPRLKTQMETLVPFALDKTIEAQRALEQTGHFLAGIKDQLPEPHRFQSSDLYKVMEGAAYLLHNQDNRELEKRMDDIIDIIAKAQKDDGYLYVAHITGTSKNHDHWGGGGMGDKPYSFVLHSHELYNMGHMYEGAIAYYQATGKDKWLKVAEKSAEHINKVFFEGDPNYNNGKPINQAPGHEELELALTKLYRVTGKQLYLDMAQKFLDIRGKTYVPEGEGVMSPSYAQQHMPVKDQRKAVGHAVRATYLYSGMADVGALKGVSDYNEALESIWHDIVDTKMSITGGLGAIHGIEGFGPEYVLPNKEAYNETCAAVGNVFFNYRMFLLTKDARYMDVAEVSLLNNSLAGVNIEGNKFFYVNPLEADGSTPFNQGRPGRSPWFHTACCPSNIARLMPQVSGMMYSHTEDEVYVTFYASSSTEVELADGKVKIEQKSEYPFDGKIDLVISPKNKQKFKLKLRIPTWARSDQFVPGELYHYMDEEETKWKLTVNGQRMDGTLEDGFVTIDREWGNGDKISLDLPMPIRFSQSIEQVAANNDRIAVTRGPLVYAAEGIDNQGQVQQFYFGSLPSISKVKEEIIQDGILKDVVKVKIPANKIDTEGGKDITMIPYYAWNNRDEGSMIVWIPTDKEQVQFSNNGIAIGGKYSEVKASSINKNGSLNAISDPRRPTSSEDSAIQPWISENGEKQWVEIRLKKPRPIRSIGVYWFADKHMNVDLPKSWDIQYKKDGKWIAMDIYVTDQYSKDKDQYNVVHPGADLVADEIRLNIVQEKEKFIGILDVDINFDDIH